MNLHSMQQALYTRTTHLRAGADSIISSLPNYLSLFRFRYLPIMVLTGTLAQSASAADIQLKIDNITELSGTLYWSIYDSENSYATEKAPVLAGQSKVTADTLALTLHDMPQGNYAVKLFHDANDNGEMDTNLIGLPQEGYGFSNNAGSFGPASYSDAKVEVKDNILINIRLR